MIQRCKHLGIERLLQSRPPKGTAIENPKYCDARNCSCQFQGDPDSCLDYEEFWFRGYQKYREDPDE